MGLFKKQTVHHTLNGKRVSSTTPGAIRTTTTSRKWYGRLRDAHGRLRDYPLSTDKSVSRRMFTDLERRIERQRAGLDTPHDEHLRRPLPVHLDDYRAFLASQGNSPEWVATTTTRITAILTGCGFRRVADLDVPRVTSWLAAQRHDGRFGVKTSNHYLTSIKSFSRWLHNHDRCPTHRLIGLRRMNADVDRRRQRRTLTPDDLTRLLTTTQQSSATYSGADWSFTGEQRYRLYKAATLTGLRASELAGLTPGNFDMALDPPTITVPARLGKNKRDVVLPIHPDLVPLLTDWLPTIPPDGRLFPGSWAVRKRGASMLKRDLKAAGIPYQDGAGRQFDFHALRHQFITELSRNGAHPATARDLARHSTIDLTMSYYTHLKTADLRRGFTITTI